MAMLNDNRRCAGYIHKKKQPPMRVYKAPVLTVPQYMVSWWLPMMSQWPPDSQISTFRITEPFFFRSYETPTKKKWSSEDSGTFTAVKQTSAAHPPWQIEPCGRPKGQEPSYLSADFVLRRSQSSPDSWEIMQNFIQHIYIYTYTYTYIHIWCICG